MILRFAPGATEEERGAVAAALESMDVEGEQVEDIVVLGRVLTEEEALGLAALPGVAAIAPSDPRALTVREELLRRTAAACLVLGVLTLVASNLPISLGPPADPLRTPAQLRPEWPMLAWYALVDRAPPWFPVAVLPLVGGLLLVAWPWVARRLAERRPRLHGALGGAALLAGVLLGVLEALR
jgi:hypothetical protein